MNDNKISKMCDKRAFGIDCYVLHYLYVLHYFYRSHLLKKNKKEKTMPRLTKNQSHEAVGMLRFIIRSAIDVARFFNMHRSTIHHIHLQRLTQSWIVSEIWRSA